MLYNIAREVNVKNVNEILFCFNLLYTFDCTMKTDLLYD